MYIYINQYKKYVCVLSVCVSKHLRWFNKQVKRELRSYTRPVSRLYDFIYIYKIEYI